MNTDDEDREWLEACIAAVDKIPAANLHHPSRVTSHHSHVLSGSSTSTTSGRTLDSGLGVSASRDSATTSHHSSMPGGFRPPNNRASRPPAAGTGRAVNSMTRPLRCIGVAQSIPYVKSKSAPAHDNFRSHATIRRFGRLQGVGAHVREIPGLDWLYIFCIGCVLHCSRMSSLTPSVTTIEIDHFPPPA